MNMLRKWLGIHNLLKAQIQTNILLERIITLQKHNINNHCEVHSNKKRVR